MTRLTMQTLGLAAAISALPLTPPGVAAEPTPLPVAHEELSRALDELAGRIHGLGGQWREHFSSAGPGERPLISIMLSHRADLGLSEAQVSALERLRADFQREAIRRDADLRVAETDLRALLASEPVDMGRVEAKVREIERLRADLRLARIRTIEQGKGQLSIEQRERLRALLAEPPRPRTGGPGPFPGSRL
jgi:Spy/CpxP family protein refolding chaperone